MTPADLTRFTLWSVMVLALIYILGLAGCGKSGSESSYDLKAVGWGPADQWHNVDVALVDYAASRGLGFIVTEHFPTVQSADWKRGQLLTSFPAIAREWNERACSNGQTHIVFLVNWNVLPFRDRSDDWFRGVVHEALDTYNPSCTWLEAVVEPDDGDVPKAERWTQMAASIWPGKLILPEVGGGWGQAHTIDHHPLTVKGLAHFLNNPPPGWIAVTDGGPFVNPPSILPDIPKLVDLALASNVPLIFYTDRWDGDHMAVIDAIAP